jgi:hypothetical protein
MEGGTTIILTEAISAGEKTIETVIAITTITIDIMVVEINTKNKITSIEDPRAEIITIQKEIVDKVQENLNQDR